MKCNSCGSEWKTDASRSASITVCPFCQEKIVVEKSNDWQFFDNTKELLAYIATEYGNDALFGRKNFSDHSLPSMPQGQKNLVKQAFDCGAVKILQENLNSDKTRKETAIKQAVGKLMNIYSIAKDAAERVVWEFTNAIDWGMPEPQMSVISDHLTDFDANNPPIILPPTPDSEANKLMTRAWFFAEDGDWKDAADYFNKVLDTEPTYAPAYLGLLCVDLKISNENKLANVKNPDSILNHKYYKRAIADPLVKARIDSYLLTIKSRIDAEQRAAAAEAERQRKIAEEATRKKRIQDAFNSVCKTMDNANSQYDYEKVIIAFTNIDSNYKDINNQIKSKIAECETKKEAARKRQVQNAFESACMIMHNAKKADDYQKAIIAFGCIDTNYQDINKQIKSRIAECETKKADAEEAARKKRVQDAFDNACKIMDNAHSPDDYSKTIIAFGSIDSNYEDINKKIRSRVDDCETIKTRLEEATRKQREAEAFQKACFIMDRAQSPDDYLKAITAFGSIESNNQDINIRINNKVAECKTKKAATEEKLEKKYGLLLNYLKSDSVSVISADISAIIRGELVFVKLGDIDWRVLTVENNKALLISEKVLEERPYHQPGGKITWKSCTMCKYLNNEFYNKLGSAKSAVAEICNSDPKNPRYGTRGDKSIIDKVFLLSLDEVCRYFGDSTTNIRMRGSKGSNVFITDSNNSIRITYNSKGEARWWWLRSPGTDSSSAAYVSSGGDVGVSGRSVKSITGGVRPALWLNL